MLNQQGSSVTGTVSGGGSALVLGALLGSSDFSGTIDYTPDTNGSPECAAVEGCMAVQRFNGNRPPT